MNHLDRPTRVPRQEGQRHLKSHARAFDRIDRIYAARGYDLDPTYSDSNPAYLQRVQRIERLTLAALGEATPSLRLDHLRVLDYGCGNGRWMGRWLAWGANPGGLHGVDVRKDAIATAKESFPSLDFEVLNGPRLPYRDDYFDVVTINLVFSSILEIDLRTAAAQEVSRVLRPGGLLLWHDFTMDNPRNQNVRGIRRSEILDLFPRLLLVSLRRVTLAPPLASRLARVSISATDIVEWALPPLRTHAFVVLRANCRQSEGQ